MSATFRVALPTAAYVKQLLNVATTLRRQATDAVRDRVKRKLTQPQIDMFLAKAADAELAYNNAFLRLNPTAGTAPNPVGDTQPTPTAPPATPPPGPAPTGVAILDSAINSVGSYFGALLSPTGPLPGVEVKDANGNLVMKAPSKLPLILALLAFVALAALLFRRRLNRLWSPSSQPAQ